MSIQFFNPPVALLSTGNKNGAEISGSLSILAMDESHNLHLVNSIFSELSWGEFYKKDRIRDQINKISVRYEDVATLWDTDELIKRLVDAFDKIIENNWIFFGIADFESNYFSNEMLISGLDFHHIDKLMKHHQKIRDHNKFPVIIHSTDDNEHVNYISTKFNGNNSNYFHFKKSISLSKIYQKLSLIHGSAGGIVFTSENAANFYILNNNICLSREKSQILCDKPLLDRALNLMDKNIIFPISWFKINLGLYSLRSLDNWKLISKNIDLEKILKEYFKYVKNLCLQNERKIQKQMDKNGKLQTIDVKSMSKNQILEDLYSLEEILKKDQLGLFGEND